MSNHFLRLNEVMQRTGLSRTVVYSLISKGEFPKPIRITERCVAWLASAIDAWVDMKVQESLSHT